MPNVGAGLQPAHFFALRRFVVSFIPPDTFVPRPFIPAGEFTIKFPIIANYRIILYINKIS